MEKYEFYYKNLLIGHLFVQNNKHYYKPLIQSINQIKDSSLLSKFMCEESSFYKEEIPFFKNRLFNMKRNNLKILNYQTDYFTLKNVELAYQDEHDRIEKMEHYYDLLLNKDQNVDLKEIRKCLEAYYVSGLWLHDYTLDEKGLILKECKRGVLSEDGLYHILSETLC